MLRIYALVPAAGKSERMGRPKLTLGLGDASVIQRVVRALEAGGADYVFVVAPPVPEPGAVVLANHARVEGAWVVHCPAPTADMRATVEVGLDDLTHGLVPPPDGLLLCPGDSPRISPALVKAVVARFRQDPARVVVPVHAGKKGHPVALPWALARTIPDLPPGVGINALVESQGERLIRLEVDDPGAVIDLDTPEDYRRLVGGTGPGA
jgi:molybdenum cofactor cytidylyltransferase